MSTAMQIWANLLVVSFYLLGVGLGSAVLLALLWVTGARWSDTIRPAVEKLVALLPVGAIGVALVLIACPSLYPWTREDPLGPSGSAFQTIWLDRPFFLLRALIYVALWLAFAFFLLRDTPNENATDSRSMRAKKRRISAVFLVVFALTCWLASTDWIMSLEPQWSSSIFGLYNFCGIFLSALAAVIVLAVLVDRRQPLHGRLTRDQLRDLGTLLFAFSSFWMYIWFSQYLLIWYVNNPEEADYFVIRQQDPWQPLFFANLILNWGLPFLVLLFRPAKESSLVLLIVAVIVLLGHWVDLYLMILPPVARGEPVFGIWDVGLVVGALGLAVLVLAAPGYRRHHAPRDAAGRRTASG